MAYDTAFRRARFARRSRRRITVAQRRRNADEVCWQVNEDDKLPTGDRRRATSRSVDRTLHCSTVSAITHKPCARSDHTSARHAHRARSPRERLPRGRGVTCGPALGNGPAVKLVGNCRKLASHPVATAWARAINSERLERMKSASAALTSAPDRLPRLSNEM